MNEMSLKKIAEFFVESHDWNGIPLGGLNDAHQNADWLREQILLGTIDIQDARAVVNPHIRRIPLTESEQLDLLSDFSPGSVCVYPTESLLRDQGFGAKIDTSPHFARLLYQGHAQIELVYFNLEALDRYMRDPRYAIIWGSTQGSLSIRDKYYKDPSIPENARLSFDTFGLAIDASGYRCMATFIRYLSKLDRSQQAYWESFLHPIKAKPTRQYFQSAILGEWPDGISVISAIHREMVLINEILDQAKQPHLFSVIPDREKLPHYLSSFIKPTKYDFDLYAASLEQLVLGKINNTGVTPFKDEPEYGQIHGFKKFAECFVGAQFTNEAVKFCKETIDIIVKSRQNVAHNIGENEFNIEFDTKRRDLNERTYNLLNTIRVAIERHFDTDLTDQILEKSLIHNY